MSETKCLNLDQGLAYINSLANLKRKD